MTNALVPISLDQQLEQLRFLEWPQVVGEDLTSYYDRGVQYLGRLWKSYAVRVPLLSELLPDPLRAEGHQAAGEAILLDNIKKASRDRSHGDLEHLNQACFYGRRLPLSQQQTALYQLALAHICSHQVSQIHIENDSNNQAKRIVPEASMPLNTLTEQTLEWIAECRVSLSTLEADVDNGSAEELQDSSSQIENLLEQLVGLPIPLREQMLLDKVQTINLEKSTLEERLQWASYYEQILNGILLNSPQASIEERVRELQHSRSKLRAQLHSIQRSKESAEALKDLQSGLTELPNALDSRSEDYISLVRNIPEALATVSKALQKLGDPGKLSIEVNARGWEGLHQLELALSQLATCYLLRASANERVADGMTSVSPSIAANREHLYLNAFLDYQCVKSISKHLETVPQLSDTSIFPSFDNLFAEEDPRPTLLELASSAVPRTLQKIQTRTTSWTKDSYDFLCAFSDSSSPRYAWTKGTWCYHHGKFDTPLERYSTARGELQHALEEALELSAGERAKASLDRIDIYRMRFDLDRAILREKIAKRIEKATELEQSLKAEDALRYYTDAVTLEEQVVALQKTYEQETIARTIKHDFCHAQGKAADAWMGKAYELVSAYWEHDRAKLRDKLSPLIATNDRYKFRRGFPALIKHIEVEREANNLQDLHSKLAQIYSELGKQKESHSAYGKAINASESSKRRKDLVIPPTISLGTSTLGSTARSTSTWDKDRAWGKGLDSIDGRLDGTGRRTASSRLGSLSRDTHSTPPLSSSKESLRAPSVSFGPKTEDRTGSSTRRTAFQADQSLSSASRAEARKID